MTTIRVVLACALAWIVAAGAAGAAAAADNAGQSGGVSWQVVDVVQSRLAEEQATRWDFVVALKLTGQGDIAFERIESINKGQPPRPRPIKARLRSGETLRFYHWERTGPGETARTVIRRYVGQDDKGTPVTVDAQIRLDAQAGARKPPPASARVAAPALDTPMPLDLRVIPPPAGSPARWAGFSGIWTGKWAGSGRAHSLVVEEVGPQEAVVVYSSGAFENREGSWFRRKARIADEHLIVDIAHDERVTYTRTRTGLAGAWTHDAGKSGRIAMAHQAVVRPATEASLARAARLNSEALTALLDGQYADALPRAQEALALREAALGPQHPDVAASLTTLAEVYRGQGKLTDAERLHRQALAIREARFGKESPEVAASLNHLAVLYNAKATYREAEDLLTRALQIVDKSKGPRTTGQANRVKAEVLENLAKVYRAQGRVAEAEEAQAKAAILWAIQ